MSLPKTCHVNTGDEGTSEKELTPLMVVSSWLPMRMESPPAAGAGVPTAAVPAAGVGAAAGPAEAGAGVLQCQSGNASAST